MSLTAVLSELRDRPSGHAFTVAPVPGNQGVLLGVDTMEHPVLFVLAEAGAVEPPLRTNKVSLHIGQSYSLAGVDDTPRFEVMHALRCETSNSADVETFILLVEAFLARQEPGGVTQKALTSFFRSMVRLFAVTRAKDLQAARRGLWGELFMMSRVRGFRFWAPLWHSEVTRRFDFSFGNNRIEVKITTRLERTHYFSHRQIYAIEGEEIVIASLVAAEDDSGLSLRQLIEDCRSALLGTPDHLKLEKAVRQAGMESPSETGPVINAAEAEESLAWFCSMDIPHFRVPEPAGVTETRYKVDLSTAPRVTARELDEWLRPWSLEFSRLELVGKYGVAVKSTGQ